ncbi:MAG: hypothetical protein IMF15_07500, partial [Proteobacteria bacterium]|nr:hypothetical protein [Pseudomonadota bacterium]
EGDRRERQCTEPYLIINAAINLVDSKRLAWQKRKAASFTFTPQYCGYEFCGENDNKPGKENIGRVGGFVGSEHYAGDTHGISLGKAMTISGAAASPNMGYHSSPALTFLMTTFNVRLGWWLPNTTKENSMRISSSAPGWGLLYLWNELLGKTDSKSDYVYLSDGGHFENLGIYELVRRRCYIIVACDAEADPDMTFSGLGNALEKCQIDLGVPIDIDVSQIKRDSETGKSQWHCAVGCIRYSEADKDQPDGILVYIKSSLTGDEPLSVETYANSHKDFPHESTVDQWFDETQFESYRALGEHIATAVLENAVDIARSEETNLKDRIDRVVMELHKQWYAGSDPYSQKPEDHDEQLESIMDTLRTDKHLVFLDGQLYPNLQIVAKEHFDKKDPGKRSTDPVEDTEDDSIADTVDKSRGLLPADYEEFRAGFYFCKRLIQFMQQIYYDRHLDLEYAAPRNRGWMNLFRRWSWSQMLRFTWTMTAGTYGARFQSFCEYRLGLDSGDLEFKEKPFDIVIPCGSRPGQQSGNQSVQYDVRFLHLSDDDDAEEIDWKKAQSEYNFHHYETLLIREFINAYIKHEDVAAIDKLRKNQDPFVFHVYPLKVKTNDPVVDDTNQDINLNFGFIITGPAYFKSGKKNIPGTYGDAVLYFRIRPSMRNMDLARKVIKECGNHEMLKKWHLINLTISKNERRCKAYPDVYSMDKESLCYCRWLSRLREESADEEQHVSK